MAKKEICLAVKSDLGFTCLVNFFSSPDKQIVVAQCPCKGNFEKCLETFESKDRIGIQDLLKRSLIKKRNLDIHS